jgi:hypothetical protein
MSWHSVASSSPCVRNLFEIPSIGKIKKEVMLLMKKIASARFKELNDKDTQK